MLRSCPHCDGFIPPHVSVCPNCDASVSRGSRLSTVCKGAAGATAMMTLMACYGAPDNFWEILDEDAGTARVLDASTPAANFELEVVAHPSALRNPHSKHLSVRIALTPGDDAPGTAVADLQATVTFTVRDATPVERTVMFTTAATTAVVACAGDDDWYDRNYEGTNDPDACDVDLPGGLFEGCNEPTCTNDVSVSVTVDGGSVTVEPQAAIGIEGYDEERPRLASTSVDWVE